MGSRAFPSGLGQGSPRASVSLPYSAAPGSMVLSKEPTRMGLRVVLCWAWRRQLVRESCLLPSLHLLLPGWQTSSPALSWHGVPLGGSPGFTGASLSSSTASLQIAHLAWEPLQPPWAVARIPSHLPFSLLGLCKGELHARVCPLLSILIQHLRSPPSNSPAPAGPPAVQLLSDPVSLEVVSDHTS